MRVEHIDFTSNPNGINKIKLISFEDISLVDHLAIYNLIPDLALKLNIPLLYGEKIHTWIMEVIRKESIKINNQ